MQLNRLTSVVLVGGCLITSCASRPPRISTLGTPCSVAGSRLSEAWRGLDDALRTPGGCEADSGIHCDSLRAQIQRLAVDCGNNPDVVMANALLAFDARNYARAQQLLDELLGLHVSYPEAAVLRARIAMEQGNSQFALRFLDQQIRQTGDNAGLRETYASALFVSNRLNEAEAQLLAAKRLGAPVWRIAYGQGLIEESRGNFEDAKRRFQEALLDRAGWKPAESRLKGLIVSGKVAQ